MYVYVHKLLCLSLASLVPRLYKESLGTRLVPGWGGAHWVGVEEDDRSSQHAAQELAVENRGRPYPSLRVEESSEESENLKGRKEN